MKLGLRGRLAPSASSSFPAVSAFASADDLAALGERARRHLWHRFALHCEAMTWHALSNSISPQVDGTCRLRSISLFTERRHSGDRRAGLRGEDVHWQRFRTSVGNYGPLGIDQYGSLVFPELEIVSV
jgi:hypothetical protein